MAAQACAASARRACEDIATLCYGVAPSVLWWAPALPCIAWLITMKLAHWVLQRHESADVGPSQLLALSIFVAWVTFTSSIVVCATIFAMHGPLKYFV